MGDAGRISKILVQRSNYQSSDEKKPPKPLRTPEQLVRGPKVSKRSEETRDSTVGRRSEASYGSAVRNLFGTKHSA